jgi:hypothetical protein
MWIQIGACRGSSRGYRSGGNSLAGSASPEPAPDMPRYYGQPVVAVRAGPHLAVPLEAVVRGRPRRTAPLCALMTAAKNTPAL